jgi:hypothetical protein
MFHIAGRAVNRAGLALTLVGAMLAQSALADPRAEVRSLYDALDLGGVVRIMQTEGRAYGADLEVEMFAGRGGAAWDAVVADIYDTDDMETVVLDGLDRQLADTDLSMMLAFFLSDRGQRIIQLELSAREALLNDEIEELAELQLQNMRKGDDPRLAVLTDFIEANDLIESNVVGGMNSSFAFYQGLRDGGAFEDTLSEDQILTDVWAQEVDIRTDTTDWIYSYLALAYQPLEDADIQAYTEFSISSDGQILNRALFDAFDDMYTGISRALGRTAAQYLTGEDI